MFNGLKEKFSNFTESVDEEVDEGSAAVAEEANDVTDGEFLDPSEDPSPDGGEADTSLTERAKTLATGKRIIDEATLSEPLEELRLALLSGNVEYDTAEAILDGVQEELTGEKRSIGRGVSDRVEDALGEALRSVLSANQFDFDQRVSTSDKPFTIIFTGVNGVGKTTTIAKMSRYFEERGLSTVMANGDTYRAGAHEQIRDHADALDTKLIAHEQGSDPAAVLYDAVEYAEANDVDVVLGDTAGRLHTDEGLMAQLSKIDRVVDPDMTLFVDEAVAGQDAVNRASEFGEVASADGAILTMAEADDSGGAAVSVSHSAGLPLLFLGTGQEYDDLEPFDPDAMVNNLLSGE